MAVGDKQFEYLQDVRATASGRPFFVGYLPDGYTANASISISQSALTSAVTPTVERAVLTGLAAVLKTSPYAAFHPEPSRLFYFV